MDPEHTKPAAAQSEPSARAMDSNPPASDATDAASGSGDKKQWRDKGVRGNKRKWQQHGGGDKFQHGSRGKRKDIGRGEYMYAPAAHRSTPQLTNVKPQPTRQARP